MDEPWGCLEVLMMAGGISRYGSDWDTIAEQLQMRRQHISKTGRMYTPDICRKFFEFYCQTRSPDTKESLEQVARSMTNEGLRLLRIEKARLMEKQRELEENLRKDGMGCRHEEGEDKEDLKSYPHENNNVKESKPQNVEAEEDSGKINSSTLINEDSAVQIEPTSSGKVLFDLNEVPEEEMATERDFSSEDYLITREEVHKTQLENDISGVNQTQNTGETSDIEERDDVKLTTDAEDTKVASTGEDIQENAKGQVLITEEEMIGSEDIQIGRHGNEFIDFRGKCDSQLEVKKEEIKQEEEKEINNEMELEKIDLVKEPTEMGTKETEPIKPLEVEKQAGKAEEKEEAEKEKEQVERKPIVNLNKAIRKRTKHVPTCAKRLNKDLKPVKLKKTQSEDTSDGYHTASGGSLRGDEEEEVEKKPPSSEIYNKILDHVQRHHLWNLFQQSTQGKDPAGVLLPQTIGGLRSKIKEGEYEECALFVRDVLLLLGNPLTWLCTATHRYNCALALKNHAIRLIRENLPEAIPLLAEPGPSSAKSTPAVSTQENSQNGEENGSEKEEEDEEEGEDEEDEETNKVPDENHVGESSESSEEGKPKRVAVRRNRGRGGVKREAPVDVEEVKGPSKRARVARNRGGGGSVEIDMGRRRGLRGRKAEEEGDGSVGSGDVWEVGKKRGRGRQQVTAAKTKVVAPTKRRKR